jgi:hypothetical protein
MTTGRINQVTIRLEPVSCETVSALKGEVNQTDLSFGVVIKASTFNCMTSEILGAVFLAEIGSTNHSRSSLSPDLTSFEYDLQVRAPSKRRDLSHDPKRRLPTLGRTVKATTTRRIFEWLIAI